MQLHFTEDPMKKFSILGLTLMIAVALVATPAFAGNCGSKASSPADKASCTASKTTTADASKDGAKAQMVNSKDNAKASSCAKTCGVEAAKACTGAANKATAKNDEAINATMANATGACPTTGKCQEVTLAIKGMTCSGCEAMITKALMETDGVYKVASIDHKTGTAQICFNPEKMEGAKIASVVTAVGYESAVSQTAAVHEAGSEAGSCHSKASTDEKGMGY